MENDRRTKQNPGVGIPQGPSWKYSCLYVFSLLLDMYYRKYKLYIRIFFLSKKVTTGETKLTHKKKFDKDSTKKTHISINSRFSKVAGYKISI